MKIIIIILAIFSLPSVELGHLESKYYEYHNIILGNRLSRRLLVVSGITANANPPIPTLRKEGRKEEHIFLVVSYYARAHPFPSHPPLLPSFSFIPAATATDHHPATKCHTWPPPFSDSHILISEGSAPSFPYEP